VTNRSDPGVPPAASLPGDFAHGVLPAAPDLAAPGGLAGAPVADGRSGRPGVFGAAGRWTGARWRGEAPLGIVFWRDMLLYGTMINVVATLASLMLLAFDAPAALATAIFFLPLPWNFFLFYAVWRCAALAGLVGAAAQILAALWLVGATAL
jgi:hypothetical protein